MVRALTHVGLAAILVIAPSLCCCNVRLLAGLLAASPRPACPARPQTEPPTCCHAAELVKNASCCRDSEPTSDTRNHKPTPARSNPNGCDDLCYQRPEATPPKGATPVDDPEPTGELLPVSCLGLADIPSEHIGLLGGLEPPERAGVDARSAALFSRHVLRC